MLRSQAPAPIPCDDCAAPCCRGENVVLDGYDLYRLTTALAMPAAEFTELTLVEGPEPHGEHRILLSGVEAPASRSWHAPVLRKLPDADPEHRFRCVFLVTPRPFLAREARVVRGRCGVYAMQPGQCAAYPTALDGNELVARKDAACPTGPWDVSRLDIARRRGRHLALARRRALEEVVVAAWNRHLLAEQESQTATVLWGYLHNVWRELLRLDPALASDAAPAEGASSAEELVGRVLSDMGWQSADAHVAVAS